jgi:hypothetical protein
MTDRELEAPDGRTYRRLIDGDEDLERLAEGLAQVAVCKDEIDELGKEALARLITLIGSFDYVVKRIEALEERPVPKYLGAWKAKRMYAEESFVTSDGSIWHANQSTDTKPGTDNNWTLAVKKGRDGR